MTDITAAEFRIAEKVARSLGFVTAQSYADHAARLESAGVTLDAQLAQTLRQVASPSFADQADYWGTLATAALEFLTSTGCLIPAGGMALTAEQVEDVRTAREELRGYRNFTGYARSHVNQLVAAVDALFPATEPAEVISRYQTMQRGFAAKHFGFPANPVFEDRYTAPDGGKWQWTDELQWELRCYPPAPAVPAGEETKAELCAVRLCVLPARHSGVHADREGLRWQNPAVLPVVPAPTETGPWKRIEDVPETVGRLTDRDGDVWEWDGDNWVTPETAILPTTYINKHYAPFVAAAEEG